MNEQEARTITAQATSTLVANHAETVQLGKDWVVVIATKAKTSDNTMPSYQVFGSRMEWNAATYTRHASHLGTYAIYSPSQQIAVLYIDNQHADTNTMHFQTMPTTKEVAAWATLYLNARLNSVLTAMHADGITELTT